MMKRFIPAALLAATLLTGCAYFSMPEMGITVEELIDAKGRPDVVYQDGENKILEWGMGTWGQFTYMATIGPDGRLKKYDQVHDMKYYNQIEIDKFTKEQVLKLIGRPIEVEYLHLTDLEVWSYRHIEEGVWHSIMYIYFDEHGIVRRMENGQDPLYLRDN